ncbi:MAG: alpha/beta hydrolase [Planctomycetota bacterium]|jgi:pimeloyl-ACP methyl ester carboxylesterase
MACWSKCLCLLWPLAAAGCTNLVDAFAFHPHPVAPNPLAGQTRDAEEITIESSDGVPLQAFFLSHPESKRVVLFLHGNGGNVYQRLDYARQLRRLELNVLLLSYRGYGKSGGEHTEEGVYRDAESALDYLRDAHGFDYPAMFIMGRSLGSAVAVHVAQHKPLAGLILVSPLATGREVVRDMGLGWIGWVAGNPFDTLNKIPNVLCPTLFVHGDQDRLIPIAQGQKLFEACPDPKSFQVVRGANHDDVMHRWSWRFWRMIERFLLDPAAMESSDDALRREGGGRRFRRSD